jgi:hypothetical protein
MKHPSTQFTSETIMTNHASLGTPGTQHNDWGSMRDHQVQPQDAHDDDKAHDQDKAPEGQQAGAAPGEGDVDGLADKKPEELTPEELRLMADTMPGEGPGD